jgi:PAS domain S-box-containing protein
MRRAYKRFNLQSADMRLNLQNAYEGFNIRRVYERFNMQRVYKRFSIAIGFLMLLVLLAANTVITQHLLDIQTNDQTWVAHTQQVLAQVAQIQSFMTNAETGQRAYVTTQDPNYLVPYDLAVTQLEPSVQQLADLTKDNPQEQAKVANLRSLALTKMNMLSANILLFQSGNRDTAREMAVSERGRLLTVKINELLNELAREQSSLKGSWSATYQSSVGRTIAALYLASGIVAIGLIILAYYILREVNRRDRRARARLAREKWFRSVLTSLGDAVIATDKRGLVTFLNSKAEGLMGIQLLQAKGQPVEKVFPLFDEATLQPIESSVTKVIQHGDPVDLRSEAFLKSSNGHLISIKDTATLIRDSRDQTLGAVLVFRDATYERQTHKLLRTTDGFTVSAELLATASRQIDAPLVAASDMIYIAKLSEGIPTDASDLLTLAEGYLGRASYIAREVLGFYREFAPPPEQIDLSTLVDSVLSSFSNKLHSKNITIERDYHDCPSVSGLSGELSQAIANLLSNAIDAVPFGGTIRALLSCRDNADRRVIMLSIRDNGPGISPATRDRLFEPFFTTKEGTGYGLGLWTAKRIVERHGGSIQVECEDGNPSIGAVFSVLLPVNASSDPMVTAT